MNKKELSKLFLKFYDKKHLEEYFEFLKNTKSKILQFEDPILLTYPDSVKNLKNLNILSKNKSIKGSFKSFHILPFFESNSDGGFAASSYTKIDKEYGSWNDIKQLSDNYALMIDAIFNHTSNEHQWFQNYLEKKKKYSNFYIEYEKEFDYSKIIRPRTNPLFTKYKNKKVLTTFSTKQIDLNINEVKVFFKLLETAKKYIQNNISTLRLDAIPYIIKEPHTTCSNLPKTYLFTKLLIESIKYINKDIKFVTEANFADKENFNYLTKASSDYIYQFSFSHLLIYCMYKNDFKEFVSWFNKTKQTHNQSIFFLSNHDGFALSGVRRIIMEKEFNNYISIIKKNKIKINYRQNQISKKKEPYEVNTTLYSYLKSFDKKHSNQKFIMLLHILTQMNGKILLYYLDLIQEENNIKEFEKNKENRVLHRKKFTLHQYEKKLSESESFEKIQEFIKLRKKIKGMETKISFRKPFLIISKQNCNKKLTTYYNISENIQKIKKENIEIKPYEFKTIIT